MPQPAFAQPSRQTAAPSRSVSVARLIRRAAPLVLGSVLALLSGCVAMGDPERPIPTVLVPAPQPAQRLMVVLPGRGDDLAGLQASGIVHAVQGAWPDADVVLAELTLGYYMRGDAPERLHREVILPARARGYREIWLAGASMGGMGTLMYERLHPGELDGLVLLAPFLGDRPLLREIRQAGGLAAWDPGPVQQVDGKTWQRELWRHLKSWSGDSDRPRQVWLAYGDRDYLRDTLPPLAGLLPEDQVSTLPGGHTWTVWNRGMREALLAADRKAGRTP